MLALGYFLGGLGRILDLILTFYLIILFVRAVLSWFEMGSHGPSPYRPRISGGMANFYISLKYWIVLLTEPLLRPIRKRVRIPGLPIDLAFIILVLVVIFLRFFLVGTLLAYAARLTAGV